MPRSLDLSAQHEADEILSIDFVALDGALRFQVGLRGIVSSQNP